RCEASWPRGRTSLSGVWGRSARRGVPGRTRMVAVGRRAGQSAGSAVRQTSRSCWRSSAAAQPISLSLLGSATIGSGPVASMTERDATSSDRPGGHRCRADGQEPRAADRRRCVGFMRRHATDHVRAHARIVAGELGRLLLFTSRQYDVDPPPPAVLDPRTGGGIMLDMGTHEFDSARFLMGSEITEVQATGSVQLFPEVAASDDVDTAVVNLKFASGAIGSIELSRRVAFGEDVRTEVHGTAASAFIGGLPIASGSAIGREGGIRWDASPPSTPRFAAAYTDQARAFARSIQCDEPVSPSGADGRAAFLVAAAADRAIRGGGTVRVAELESDRPAERLRPSPAVRRPATPGFARTSTAETSWCGPST